MIVYLIDVLVFVRKSHLKTGGSCEKKKKLDVYYLFLELVSINNNCIRILEEK